MSPSSPLSGKIQTPSAFSLFGTRRFAPLFIAQTLGAFNDGLVAAALVVLLTAPAAGPMALRPESAATIALVVFLLPFLLGSATAGQIADKVDRAVLARRAKLFELLVMGVAALGFLLSSATTLIAALFLLGLRATLLVPTSLALLAQYLRVGELVGANSLLYTGLLVAVLTGSLAGGILTGLSELAVRVASAGLLAAVAGFSASLAFRAAPAPDPELAVGFPPGAQIVRHLALARQDRLVILSILGVAWFWFSAAALLAGFSPQIIDTMSGRASSAVLPTLMVTIGFGVGAMLCKALSGRQVELGLIPVGALGLALFLLDLALSQRLDGSWRALFDLGALGVLCGFYLVPQNVLVESKSPPQQRARVVAAGLALAALAMLAGWGVGVAGLAYEIAPACLLALAATGYAAIAAYAYFAAPHLSLRFLTDLLIHFFYRLDKKGLEHIPDDGPAVLVCNHVSFIDSVVIMAAVRRPIRFVMDYHIHRTPGVGFIFRHSRTIPIATAKENLALKETAFAAVAQALKNGELIGLFPEGRITHTGEINHFRYGVGRIVSETPVPVIPMALRGLWGSFFSRRYGPAMSKPSLLRPCARIELVVGEPVPPEQGSPENLQEIVTALRGGLV
jgi:1-acyl-sn-glycerol-3-phosphate acyltransferase